HATGTQHPARVGLVRPDGAGAGGRGPQGRCASRSRGSARRRRRCGILVAMRWLRVPALMLALAVAAPGTALASGWGGLEPGETTLEQVRERYGAPSKETKQKTEGYDTTTWVYEGTKAPVGMNRMTIDMGMLKPEGFKPEIVRVFVLEPRPTIF